MTLRDGPPRDPEDGMMQRTRRMTAVSIASVGIDIAKFTFHLVTLDLHGKVSVRKKFSRKQLLAYTAKLSTALIGSIFALLAQLF